MGIAASSKYRRQIFHDIPRGSDVVVSNFSPGNEAAVNNSVGINSYDTDYRERAANGPGILGKEMKNNQKNELSGDPPSTRTVESREPCCVEIKWKRGHLIGSGAYGDVYLALSETDGSLMAVKCLSIKERHHEKVIRSIQTEIETLRSLSHQNIVRYRGTEITEYDLNIFMDYVPGGSIASLIKKFGALCENLIEMYAKQILKGLAFLHSKKVLHRDIKGANILVDTEGVCKLADFGASKKLDDLVVPGEHSIRGTPYWMAPEIIQNKPYAFGADIWSIGCTIIEMATGKPPWSDTSQNSVQIIYRIGTSQETPLLHKDFSVELRECTHACLRLDQHQRPSAQSLLDYSFFKNSKPYSGNGFEFADQEDKIPEKCDIYGNEILLDGPTSTSGKISRNIIHSIINQNK